MGKWPKWVRAVIGFLRSEAVSSAFHSAWPYAAGLVMAAAYAIWQFLVGPSGPLALIGAAVVFAAVTFGFAILRAVRQIAETEKRTAIIEATAQIPDEEKGWLDYGAGIEQAIAELTISSGHLTKFMNEVGRKSDRHTRRLSKAQDYTFVRKRRLAMDAALDFDRSSDWLEPNIARLEKAGQLLAESFVGFVGIAPDPSAFHQLRYGAQQLMSGIPKASASVVQFTHTLQGLRDNRIQQHFSRSIMRMRGLIDRVHKTFGMTLSTCETVIGMVNARIGDDQQNASSVLDSGGASSGSTPDTDGKA